MLVSGGNVAHFVCFLAARAAKADWDVRTCVGRGAGRRLCVYGSAEMHTWIQKAADMSGLGIDAIRWIPIGADLRMDVDALRQQIVSDTAAGDLPFLVVGTAGSVSTGVVDQLRDISAVCKEHGVWFHVDGAYGGFAATLPQAPDDLRALSLADSVAVDPHKWLYAPLEACCALVRDVEALRATCGYHSPYYHFSQHALNYVDLGPEASPRFVMCLLTCARQSASPPRKPTWMRSIARWWIDCSAEARRSSRICYSTVVMSGARAS